MYGCLMAFYDISSNSILSLEEIECRPILWKLSGALDDAVKERHWPVLGHKPLEPELLQAVRTFRPANPMTSNMPYDGFRIYVSHAEAGKYDDYRATPEECVGLEPTITWGWESVARRLDDHFAGKPNAQVERLVGYLKQHLIVQ